MPVLKFFDLIPFGYNFVLGKQKGEETLRQFWHTMTGLAAKCEFGYQTVSLVMDRNRFLLEIRTYETGFTFI